MLSAPCRYNQLLYSWADATPLMLPWASKNTSPPWALYWAPLGTTNPAAGVVRRPAVYTAEVVVKRGALVNELERNSDDVVIVQTLIATALNLKMEVIAEGVETLGQAEILCHSGCCSCQGYYFGKPMPAQEFAKLLPRREA